MTSTINAPAACPYCGTEIGPQEIMWAGSLVLDPGRRELRLNGRVVPVQPLEYRLISALMQHPGKVVKFSTLYTAMRGSEAEHSKRLVHVIICKLRKKIEPAAHITNVFSIGYRLDTINVH